MKNVFYQTETARGSASPQAAAPRFLKMKRFFALLFVLFVGMQGAWAYDFSNSYYGKTFYFNIIDQTNHYVEVTYPNTRISPWYGFEKPEHQVSIPSQIDHGGITYTVTTIGEYAFYDCSGVYGLVIPNKVTTIGEYAFNFCSGLTSLTIPSTVTTIGAGAFSDCSSLSSVTIQNGVTTIGASAFKRTSISTVTIPSSVTSLGNYAFSNCSNLTSVWINSKAVASKDYTSIPNLRDNFGNQVKYYFLGTEVTVIGKKAFFGASLESVTMPNVTAIFENAFASCWSLTSVTMPSSLTGIHERAFYDCRELNSLSLNEGLTTIGDDAFASCTRLTSVTIPSTVDFMGAVFRNCSNLTSVTINSNDVASMAFLYSKFGDQVKHYILGAGVTSIGGSAFKRCTRLTSVTLPESLTTIEDFAFDGCIGLTSLTLPSNVTSIGWAAFNGCSNIASMIVRATTPPTTGPYPFDDVSTYIPVRVPWGTAHSYRENDEWSRFTIIMDNLVADTPVTIPYTQLFYDEQVSTPLPEGWHSFTATSRVHDYDYLNMTGINGSDVVMLPPVSSSSAPWLQMQYQGTTNASTLEIGYVTDPNLYDVSTFVSTKSFKGTAWNTIVAELPTLPSGARYALKSTGEIHVDHVKLFDPSTMSANNAVYYEQNFDVNSNAIPEGWLTFNGQTSIQGSGASRHLQINGNELVVLPKLTALAQKRRVMEVDVRIINTGNSTTATVNVGYMPSMDNYDGSMFVSQQQLTCAANATSKKRLYVYTDTQQSSRRFAIKTTGNATVQVDDVQVYYTYESPQQNDFICDFSNNPINNAGAYSYLVGQPSGNLYTNHGATNNWKTGNVNGVSDEHAYCDISGTEAVSSWLVMPFVKVTANNRLLSYNIAVTHKNGTQQPVNASQVHSSQFLKVYISEDGYYWNLKRTYTSSDLAAIPPTGEEVGYIRLSEYEGKTIKVAFHAGCNAGVNNNYRVHIDNVTHSNFVLSPPKNVEATNVGYEEATIRWEYTHPAQSGGFVYVPYPNNPPPPNVTNLSEIWEELTNYSSGYWQQADNYSNQCNITNLQRGTTYTAYVCTNSISPLQWVPCTFTTQNDCPTPTNLSAEVQDCMALIRWDDNGASDWQYALKKDGQYQYYEWEGQQYYEVPTYGANMVFFGDDYYNSLEPGNYSIEVRSVCDEGNYDSYGAWSEPLEFTITECNFSYPAPAFSLVNIDDVDKLTLAWSDLPLPHPAASVNVTLQFHSNEWFYSGTDDEGLYDYVTDGTTIKQYTSNDYSLIDAGLTFYVRLRAFYTLPGGSGKQSEWSDTIKVVMPDTCAAPKNIVVDASAFSATLTWEGNAESYEVCYYYYATPNDKTTIITENNSVTIEELAPRSMYDVRITGICEYGIVSETATRRFITGDNVIVFEDPNVEAICVANWDNLVIDGKLSYNEAANVTNLGSRFEETEIKSFNELQYFTGLTTIGANAFSNCIQLASITLPESLTTIEDDAFNGCESLTNIWIPEGVTTIGITAFGNTGLESISIPASVTEIENIVIGCTNLQSITVANDNPNYTSNNGCNVIVEKATNKLIAGCAYSYIYEGVKTIAQSAFASTGITTLELPSTLQTIEGMAFYDCTSLQMMDLPASLESIGNEAFRGCTSLAEITCRATTPPVLGTDAFKNVTTTIPVYVPCSKRSNYKDATTGWSTFTNIDGYDCETILLPIAGYGDDPNTTEGWNLIASPLVGNVSPEEVGNMISNDYDLYGFDGRYEGAEWRNSKNHYMTLQSVRGFLYANSNDVVLEFHGVPVNSDQIRITVSPTDHLFGKWFLVGNSINEETTLQISGVTNPNFYRIEPGTRKLMLAEYNMVEPMEGIFVEVESTSAVIFKKASTRGTRAAETPMNIELYTREGRLLDRARLRTGEGTNMSKLDLLGDDNRLSLRANGKDCAVVYVNNLGEVPLQLETANNGSYTLFFDNVSASFDYLHLIDNMTGADVDLIATSNFGMASYHFEAKTTDYASRFRLVFRATENGDDTTGTEGDSFAFIDTGGNIVITNAEADATLQVIDVMGRVVLSTDVARGVSTNGMTAGVYVLRLINGNDVKVQKIVVD